MAPEFSVIVPVFNSEKTLQELFDRTKVVFAKAGLSFEMVFVDDFSGDSSWQVLAKLKAENPENVVAKLCKICAC